MIETLETAAWWGAIGFGVIAAFTLSVMIGLAVGKVLASRRPRGDSESLDAEFLP